MEAWTFVLLGVSEDFLVEDWGKFLFARLALSILAVGFAEEDCFCETNGSSEFKQGIW